MDQRENKKPFFYRLAEMIVDKRNLIFFFYGAALAFCIVSRSWVAVCDDLTEYLPADTETRQGLTLMDEEVTTFGSARVMVSNVTYEMAANLAERLETIEGVSAASFGPAGEDEEEAEETPEERLEYMNGTNALITLTFEGEADDEISIEAMEEVKALLSPYDVSIDSQVGYSMAETLEQEIQLILVIAAVIIVLVLFLTSRSYGEIPVLVATFVAAAILNMGTNYWFDEISFVSNSVTVVLQLALAIDYAIILLHRFTEERARYDEREACIVALAAAIPSISASSLTTISGLAAMMFMQFKIGFDMGMVLIKAILFSMLSVFTLMPGLLVLSSDLLERTKHKEFIPSISWWGKFAVKCRYFGVTGFAVVAVAAFFLSRQCPYVFGSGSAEAGRKNETQLATERVEKTFGEQNVVALLVPVGEYEKEKELLARLERYDEVETALGLSNIEAMDGYMLTDSLTPREFSEIADLDYMTARLLYSAYASDREEYGRIVGGIEDYTVPLMDMFLFVYDWKEDGYFTPDGELGEDLDSLYEQLTDGRAQMLGERYSRIVLELNLPEEGEETFAFLKTIHQEAERFYDADEIYLVGESVSDYDLSSSFAGDNQLISFLSAAFVVVVLLFTFSSVGLPVLLILVIQGSIWMNFAIPAVTNTPIFFMGYLVVSSIQMGANIDYAIVISTRYTELKERMPKKEAVIEALNLAFPTVFTSGAILSSAGYLIGRISTEPVISGIGQSLCRGTLISIFLVMFVLPQILLLGDGLIERTVFKVKVPAVTAKPLGKTVYVNGHVRGRVSGVVDASMHGMIYGDVTAMVNTEFEEETFGYIEEADESQKEGGMSHEE